MHLRLLIPACVLASNIAVAQHQSQWRFGVSLAAPTRMLDVNSLTAPDSSNGRVSLGVGVGAEAARAWELKPHVTGVVFARATTAQVHGQEAGVDWSPGRAWIVEAGARVERDVSDRASLFGGAGLSHWAGPVNTAPFAGAGAVLLGIEGGVSARTGDGPWHVDLTASLTRFGADQARGIPTGFVWRWMIGVRHDH